MGREKDFEDALQKLRGEDADISEEAEEIQVTTLFILLSSFRHSIMQIQSMFYIQDYIETLQRLPKAKVFDLFQRRYLRSVIVILTPISIYVLDILPSIHQI